MTNKTFAPSMKMEGSIARNTYQALFLSLKALGGIAGVCLGKVVVRIGLL